MTGAHEELEPRQPVSPRATLASGRLSSEELRVLACLVEKQLTTPQQYPLTLNALVLACNQTSNRDPVVHYDEHTVEAAVTRAKTAGLARFVHPSHGRSALRFAHTLDDGLDLDQRRLALLSVLALRGAQTAGELRARTERMARFERLADLETELDAMARLDPPLVARLARVPGQKEDRYRQCLEGTTAERPGDGSGFGARSPTVTGPGRPDDARRETLAAELAELRAEVRQLRQELDELRAALE
jgi:uncharacterized protein